MRIAAKAELAEGQHKQLKAWAMSRRIPVRLAERARMTLLAGQDKTGQEIGVEVGA